MAMFAIIRDVRKTHWSRYTHHDQKFQKQGNIVCVYIYDLYNTISPGVLYIVFYAVCIILMECRETAPVRFLFLWAAAAILYNILLSRRTRFRSLHSRRRRRAYNNIFLDGATHESQQPPAGPRRQLTERRHNMGHVTLESRWYPSITRRHLSEKNLNLRFFFCYFQKRRTTPTRERNIVKY